MGSGHNYAIIRHDGCRISVHETRHEAVAARQAYHDANDYEIRPVTPLWTLTATTRFGGLHG